MRAPRLDDDARVDEAGRLDRRAVLDAAPSGETIAVPGRRRERRRDETAVHDVAVRLAVFLRRADVDPVAAIDVRDERLAVGDERREIAALDRKRRLGGNPVERLGLEHVDAGVDRVAADLVRRRLFEKRADVALRVGFDEPVGRRIFDRRQHDRRLRAPLAVQRDDRRQIHRREDVAVEDDERLRRDRGRPRT